MPKKKPTNAVIGDLDVPSLVRQAAKEHVELFLQTDFADQIGLIASDEARKHIQAALAKRMAAEVGPYLEGLTFTPTNTWGEKKGEPETLRDHIQRVVRTWLDEPMSYDGKTKADNSYNFRANTTRGAYLVGQHIQHHMTIVIEAMLKDAKSALGKSLEDAFKLKLNELLTSFSITVGGKKQ